MFEPKSLEEMARDPVLFGGKRRVLHVHSAAAAPVGLPALSTGPCFFEHMRIREIPWAGLSQEMSYMSHEPPVFVIEDALVHSSAGITAVGNYVAEDTLHHIDETKDAFRRIGGRIALHGAQVEAIAEPCLSILAGGCDNYYHWTLEAVARIFLLPDRHLDRARILLIPDNVPPPQRKLLGLIGISDRLEIRTVKSGEALRVQTLIYPASVSAAFLFHPCIRSLRESVLRNSRVDCDGPARIYIDRRRAWARRLRNEDELVRGIAQFGFVPVALERLSVEEQIALFRNAEFVLAPHGAGLTNLLYARPGCKVVELLMDSYVNWCFRHLSGLLGLRYDCVIGRTVGPWRDLSAAVHGAEWEISVFHVLGAVERALRSE